MVESTPTRGKRQVDKILTVDEAAAVLRVSGAVVRALLRSGQLKGRKVGRDWRVLESNIESYMREEPQQELERGSSDDQTDVSE